MPNLDLAHISAENWGGAQRLPLGDAGGLTQFGVGLETLDPGAWSSDPHWHENEDEFVLVLSGEVTLVEDTGETVLSAGDAATFAAGSAVGHALTNRSDTPATYLVVGTRAARDRVHYTTIDKIQTRIDGVRTFTRRDGSPLGETE